MLKKFCILCSLNKVQHSLCWEWFFLKKYILISLSHLLLEFQFSLKKAIFVGEIELFILFVIFFYKVFYLSSTSEMQKRLKPTIKIGSSYSNNDDWYWVFRSLKYYLLKLFSFKKILSKKNGDEITKLTWHQYQVFSGHCPGPLFIPPENIRKPLVFCFQYLWKGNICLRWVKSNLQLLKSFSTKR